MHPVPRRGRLLLAGALLIIGALSAPCLAGSVSAQASMQLASQDFAYGGAIPVIHEGNAFGCAGQNTPLALIWNSVPARTRSLAITMIDNTAPAPGGFVHWLVYNISPSTSGIGADSLGGALQGYNTTGTSGYLGPCPPPGQPHYYTFTLYALNTELKSQHMTYDQLQQAMRSHILSIATDIGTFQTS